MIDRLRAWNDSLDDPVDTRALALLRIAVAPLVIAHLRPFFGEATGPHFTLPYASWYPIAPPGVRHLILWATVVAAVATSLGLATRLAAWATVAGVGYTLFESETYFHHNRAFLVILLVGVAVLPSGSQLSADARLGTPRWLSLGGGRRLSLVVLRVEIALVYLASGSSKLIDRDWWGGTVTLIRVQRHAAELTARLPGWVIDLITSPSLHWWAAKAIVLTEIFIGSGLLWRRTRLTAVWFAIAFHAGIEATADVQVFSAAAICALVVWVTPSSHDRTLLVGGNARRGSTVIVRALDWTGRFRIAPGTGPGWEVVDRDGTVIGGRRARWLVLSRLPLVFPFAGPGLLLTGRDAYPDRVGARDSDVEVRR